MSNKAALSFNPETTDISTEYLSVRFEGKGSGGPAALDKVSLTFPGNRITGVIGESGSGKSVLAMALIGLLPSTAQVRGRILYQGRPVNPLDKAEMMRLRRRQIALIPQNPGASLNPVMKIRHQIREGAYPEAAVNRLLNDLALAGRGNQYPFQLSGGMRQRALAAIALIRNPSWLLADEPTKGLDAQLRTRIFELLRAIHRQSGTGIILISHDLPFARRLCHRIAVFYCGRLMEAGPSGAVFERPLHPYTRALLNALPQNGFIPVPGQGSGLETGHLGCPFYSRCPRGKKICTTVFPGRSRPEPDREVYCHA